MNKQIQQSLLILHISLAILWIYQGLVPKIFYHASDEQRLWELNGFEEITFLFLIELAGYAEIVFGLLFLIFRQNRLLHYFNIIAMCALALLVVVSDIAYFKQAFNPFVMNVSMATLSIVAIQLLKIEKLS